MFGQGIKHTVSSCNA
uniref:Uncharacterized protein n=1 Tax=Anguilla anguilla TaxID=7936 RepID=A0A0E9TT99_ANGAN